MFEETHDVDPPVAEAMLGEVPGIDPLEAVLAAAEPRGTQPPEGLESPSGGDSGVLVETRVRVGADTAENGAGHGGKESYDDFSWPDGYIADPAALAKFVPLARKLGLSKDSAQSLAGLYAELDQARNHSQAELVAKNNAEWLHEIQRHPEFGGGNLERAGGEVATVMRRFGSPLLAAQIRQMNLQNWPEMFYFLARIARTMGEDCSPASGPGDAPPKSTAQLLFPGLR